MFFTHIHTRTQTVMVYLPFGLSVGAGMLQWCWAVAEPFEMMTGWETSCWAAADRPLQDSQEPPTHTQRQGRFKTVITGDFTHLPSAPVSPWSLCSLAPGILPLWDPRSISGKDTIPYSKSSGGQWAWPKLCCPGGHCSTRRYSGSQHCCGCAASGNPDKIPKQRQKAGHSTV